MKHSRSMPRRLQVGPQTYKIVSWPVIEASTSNRSGECDRLNHVIRVMDSMPPGKTAEVLLHEALHGVFGLGRLWTFCTGNDGEGEEEIVARMAPLLLSLFRDNPDLMPYLMQEINRET